MTAIFIKQEDNWNKIKTPRVNIGGCWLYCKAVYVQADGIWHRVWKTADVVTLIVPPSRWAVGVQDVCISAACG